MRNRAAMPFSALAAAGVALILSVTTLAQDKPPKVVANMEKKPVYTIEGKETPPIVSISNATAAQGKMSLRFEHTGKGPRRAGITFPVDGAAGYNTLAFDIYCEQDTQTSRLNVQMSQEKEGKGKMGVFNAMLPMRGYIDGWTTVRLSANAGLEFHGAGGAQPDWGKIRGVTFALHDGGGKTVIFLDNIRFEDLRGVGSARNLMYNSSFEITTNPDTPDGWGRDFSEPPFGPDAWAIDAGQAFDGKKSLRIGAPGKFARYWIGHIKAAAGKEYTFSVYMKAAEGTKVLAQVNGLAKVKQTLDVGKEWGRYTMTGKASGGNVFPQITLVSGGPVWIDAAQLEPGAEATAYAASAIDLLEAAELNTTATAAPAPAEAKVSATLRRAAKAPVVDGVLDDACWKDAQELTPFVLIKTGKPGRARTVGKATFDDNGFYVAVRAEEPDMAAFRERLAKLPRGPWGADLVEVFLDLSHDRRTYYHFVTNVRGERYTARHATQKLYDKSPASWQAEWQAAGKMDDRGWTVEMAIPYTCFDMRPEIAVGKSLGLNVCRGDPANKEDTSWAPMTGKFHAPDEFGVVNGFDADMAPWRFDVGGLAWDKGVVTGWLKNHTGRDADAQVVVETEAPDGKRREIKSRARVAAGGSADILAPAPLWGDGFHNVFVRVVDGAGVQRLVTQPLAVRISSAAMLELDGTEFNFYTRETEARARCWVGAAAEQCAEMTLDWQVEREGKPAGPAGRATPKPGFNEWTLALKGLAHGEYAVKAALSQGGKVLAERSRSFRWLPPAEHEARINQWGRFLVCDGKPFFWYGFFHEFYRVDAKAWEAAVDDMRAARCTAALLYTHTKILSPEEIKAALDKAQAAGMKLWLHLYWFTSFVNTKYATNPMRFKSEEEALAAMRAAIAAHRNHPALLGWCTIDEPGNRPEVFTKEWTERFYRLVREMDPYHPVIFSHVPRMVDPEIYGGATDMALIPFFANRDARWRKLFHAFWDIGQPLVTNRPCYGAVHSVREPTAAEIRSSVYMPILLGGRSVCSYLYRCASMSAWGEFARIGRELETLGPILLTPDNRLRVSVTPAGGDVIALLKEHEGSYYLLALNAGQETAQATFRLLDAPPVGQVEPMLETPAASVEKASRSLTVTMPASTTAFYRIRP